MHGRSSHEPSAPGARAVLRGTVRHALHARYGHRQLHYQRPFPRGGGKAFRNRAVTATPHLNGKSESDAYLEDSLIVFGRKQSRRALDAAPQNPVVADLG